MLRLYKCTRACPQLAWFARKVREAKARRYACRCSAAMPRNVIWREDAECLQRSTNSHGRRGGSKWCRQRTWRRRSQRSAAAARGDACRQRTSHASARGREGSMAEEYATTQLPRRQQTEMLARRGAVFSTLKPAGRAPRTPTPRTRRHAGVKRRDNVGSARESRCRVATRGCCNGARSSAHRQKPWS